MDSLHSASAKHGRGTSFGRMLCSTDCARDGSLMRDTMVISLQEQEVLAAVKVLEAALMADDRTAWVYEYTEDAVFDGGGEGVIQGRAALLEEAAAMSPMRDVSIRPLRTEGSGNHVSMWCEGSWTAGDGERRVEVRGMLLWRKEDDGHWRVAIEHLGPAR